MDGMGILPFYTGICKHDGLNSNSSIKTVTIPSATATTFGNLKWVIENERQTWAQQMYDLLLNAKAAVDEAKDNSKTCCGNEPAY